MTLEDLECYLKRVDRVETKSIAEQWRLRVDVSRPDILEVDSGNNQLGERQFRRCLW